MQCVVLPSAKVSKPLQVMPTAAPKHIPVRSQSSSNKQQYMKKNNGNKKKVNNEIWREKGKQKEKLKGLPEIEHVVVPDEKRGGDNSVK